MPNLKHINTEAYPKQYAENIGSRVKIEFNGDRDQYYGTVIRDDAVEPFHTIIMLDDGRVIIASQAGCCYSFLSDEDRPGDWTANIQFHPNRGHGFSVRKG